MSSALKRAYKHKAYAEIDHLKQQLTLKSYHYDHMTAMNQALVKAGDEARAENARLRTALERIVEYDIHNPMLPVTIAQEALKRTL